MVSKKWTIQFVSFLINSTKTNDNEQTFWTGEHNDASNMNNYKASLTIFFIRLSITAGFLESYS